MSTDNREDAFIQRARRIADVGKEPLEYLSAITGYEEKPIISIEAAIEPLVSVVPSIQSQTYVAKKRCQNPANGLTQDEAASIMLYTMSWEPTCLFTVLNATLRMKDRKKLIPWFSYMKLFFVALDRLPSSTSGTLFRGVKLDLSDKYEVGKSVVWWGCSSCTVTENVSESEDFLGKTGKRTKFIIDCNSGKNIRNYSYFAHEDEVLILPATEFDVIKFCKPEPDLYEIHLKEIQPPVQLRAVVISSTTDVTTSVSDNPSLGEQSVTINSSTKISTVDPNTVEDVEELREFVPTINGYENMPMVSIDGAMKPVVSVVSYIESNACIAKRKNRNPANRLTQNETASNMLCTTSWNLTCLFSVLNDTLWMRGQAQLEPWFLYMKLLFVVLDRLPSKTGQTIHQDAKLGLTEAYEVRRTIVWRGISSCTISEDGLETEQFLSKTGKRTKFIIVSNSEKGIRNYSYYSNEDGILILPATEFEVNKVCQPESNFYVIRLKEVQRLLPLRVSVSNSAIDTLTSPAQDPSVLEQSTISSSFIDMSMLNPNIVEDDCHPLPPNDQELQLTYSSPDTISKEYNSDFVNSSHDDREQLAYSSQDTTSKEVNNDLVNSSHDDREQLTHSSPDTISKEYNSDLVNSSHDDHEQLTYSSPDTIGKEYNSDLVNSSHADHEQLAYSSQDTISKEVNNDLVNSSHDDHEQLTYSSPDTISKEYNSDFVNSSHDDHEQRTSNDLINESEEDNQQKRSILEKQKMLSKMQQEWLRKEKNYIEQLKQIHQQLTDACLSVVLQRKLHDLISFHETVSKKIENIRELEPSNFIKQITCAIEILMKTLPDYEGYIQNVSSSVKKILNQRMNNNIMSSEELLSIPHKQFLQITSQVQDLYKTLQSFALDDKQSLGKLNNCAQACRLTSSKQDEKINDVILKNVEIASLNESKHRDCCRLLFYPDAIICCYLQTKLILSSKYALLWFIPLIDLQWTTAQNLSNDSANINDKSKSDSKSTFVVLEKISQLKRNTSFRASTDTTRKTKNKCNTLHSNLRLSLSNSSSSISSVFLFSSAYQLQDWIDLIHKTKQEIIQRSSVSLNPVQTHYQRLTESLIQKRLDHVKPNSDVSSSIPTSGKIYSGRLDITIHSIHGLALLNPIRRQQTNNQFYVAIEIDRYNTFYSYAQTAKESMQQQESVEFKDEVFYIELKHSLAFRLLVYRTDTTASDNTSQCIGKVHQNIESVLREYNPDKILTIESPFDDLILKISIKYSKHADKSTRQESPYNCIIFGKSIEILKKTRNACINGIPRIIVKCTETIALRGLETISIYHVICSESKLQDLRQTFDQDYLEGEKELTRKDVHFAANLLKLFLRELPEPLFTDRLYEQFVRAIQLPDINDQRDGLLKTFKLLPPDNRKILYYLFDHLIHFSQYSDTNTMPLENLACVFKDILMRPAKLRTNSVCIGSNRQIDTNQTLLDSQDSDYQYEVVLACLKLRRDRILI